MCKGVETAPPQEYRCCASKAGIHAPRRWAAGWAGSKPGREVRRRQRFQDLPAAPAPTRVGRRSHKGLVRQRIAVEAGKFVARGVPHRGDQRARRRSRRGTQCRRARGLRRAGAAAAAAVGPTAGSAATAAGPPSQRRQGERGGSARQCRVVQLQGLPLRPPFSPRPHLPADGVQRCRGAVHPAGHRCGLGKEHQLLLPLLLLCCRRCARGLGPYAGRKRAGQGGRQADRRRHAAAAISCCRRRVAALCRCRRLALLCLLWPGHSVQSAGPVEAEHHAQPAGEAGEVRGAVGPGHEEEEVACSRRRQ